MATKAIQANQIPLELSFDNQVSWQTLVCLETYNIPVTRAITKTSTFCGVFPGVGPIDFNPAGSAVNSIDPIAGSEVTYNRLLIALNNQEVVWIRTKTPGTGSIGEDAFVKGQAYVSSLDIQFQDQQVVKFTFAFAGIGSTLDIAYP